MCPSSLPVLALAHFCFLYIYVEQLCVVPIWDKTEMLLKIVITKDRQQAIGVIDPLLGSHVLFSVLLLSVT